MRISKTLTTTMLVCLVGCGDPSSMVSPGFGGKTETGDQPLWSLDFTGLPNKVRPALESLGLDFERDMDDEDEISLSSARGRLNLKAQESTLGLLVSERLELDADWIEIDWGVEQYPAGADWTSGKNRNAIAVYVFFGEKVSSGNLFLPNIPPFIGLFLAQNAPQQKLMVGNSYQATGRYVCLGNPEPGVATTSRFNFAEAYRAAFPTAPILPVTSIAIEVDTRSLYPGTSSAFISRIAVK